MRHHLLITALFITASALTARAEPEPLPRGYDQKVQPETAEAREARHKAVAARRAQGALIICHRGAAAFAPENTLEAYAAAMDYGADGCEMDLRRTRDGVIVLFHDDMLDHLTNGFGTVNRITYLQLLDLKPQFIYGTANWETRPPTFASVLTLARQRTMLLHLDVKEPGLDDEIAAMLTEADAWDHVTGVNNTTAPKLAKDPRVKLIRFKGPGLFDKRLDMDPEAVRAQLALPGDGIMVDDPRVAAHELKRAPYQPVPVPDNLRERWLPTDGPLGGKAPPLPSDDPFRSKWIYTVDAPRPERLLTTGGLQERSDPDYPAPTGPTDTIRTERIIRRAVIAQLLAEGERKTPEIIQKLEFQVQHRTLHRDWMYHGMDGAIAARALGDLGVTAAAPLLIKTFKTVDPELKRVENPEYASNPLAWTDFRTKMYIIPALGKLKCPESKRFLMEYLAMPEAQAREMAPLLYEDATKALLRQDLSQTALEGLLVSTNPAVRGPAIQLCLDHPTRVRSAALKAKAAWALDLPRARK